jgi:acetyl-CoA carboxylase biotin carboxyl carrier protein
MGVVSNDDIRWLISLVLTEGLAELEVNEEDGGVLVRRYPSPPAGSPATGAAAVSTIDDETAELVPVRAPMAGVFYRSSAPDSPPFVEEGDDVQTGETVGLIEAMKLYNDIEAPCSGRIISVAATDAGRVAADQELMYIKPFGD